MRLHQVGRRLPRLHHPVVEPSRATLSKSILRAFATSPPRPPRIVEHRHNCKIHYNGTSPERWVSDLVRESSSTALLPYYFLPANYPQSVAPGYVAFSIRAWGASVAGSAAMVLSTQTLLLAVGVVGQASSSASILAGALNWVLKDGVGQLGGVLFASRVGEWKHLDADPKRYRLLAAMLLDVANGLEIASPFVPSFLVLPIACVANVFKNIGFLTASASRAALHQALAIQGNLADVTAKAGSQSLAASVVGTSLGIGISTLFGDHESVLSIFVVSFAGLSVLHQFGNYSSLSAVPLAHFNRQRLHIVLKHYLNRGKILSPSEVAKRERYIPGLRVADGSNRIVIGSTLETLCPRPKDWTAIAMASHPYALQTREDTIHLTFFVQTTGDEMIRGLLHAMILERDGNADTLSERAEQLPALLETHGWKCSTEWTRLEPPGAVRLEVPLDREVERPSR